MVVRCDVSVSNEDRSSARYFAPLDVDYRFHVNCGFGYSERQYTHILAWNSGKLGDRSGSDFSLI